MRIQQPQLSLAEEIRNGLLDPVQKHLPARYLYDETGSALFEQITALPEYGLTRADERLLRLHSPEIAELARVDRIVDLGSGSGEKARLLLRAFGPSVIYSPVDVSAAALANCAAHLPEFTLLPVEAEFIPGLAIASATRGHSSLLVTFLGSNIGNFERPAILPFLRDVREQLRGGDFLLLGIDLVKPVEQLLAAYDDAPGVTAAFNVNLLHRLNREFGADFNTNSFVHQARWNARQSRVEMHLCASSDQRIAVRELDLEFSMARGETIHTESSHKFHAAEIRQWAVDAGFEPVADWTDSEWPFSELLFQVTAR